MSTHKQQHPIEKLVVEVEHRQRNTTYPHTLVNARYVDTLLWKGSRRITKIQRVGVAVLGLSFLLIAVFFVGGDRHDVSWLGLPFGLIVAGIGCKLLWNSVRKNSPVKESTVGER